MTERIPRGANSFDFFLMFLADANLAPTIADGDAVVFDEDSEKFVPSSGKTVKVNNLNIKSIPTSSSGLLDGDVWSNSGVLTIVSY